MEGCVKTGHVTITDGSGALPVVCLLTQHGDSSQENILEALGSTVLLSGLTVCVERKTTAQQPGITSSTLSIYIHPQLCSVITESPRSELSNVLYFRVVNKNCVVVTALSGMRFSAQVQMGESPCSLREEDKCGSSCKIVDIALCFSEENFRWYSYVINGGVYSLSSPKKLPSLTELSQSNFLQVMSDMQLKFIDHSPLQQRVYDVTSLIDRVTLPGFLKESTTSADKRYMQCTIRALNSLCTIRLCLLTDTKFSGFAFASILKGTNFSDLAKERIINFILIIVKF